MISRESAGASLAAAVDPAGELAPDGGVFGVGLYLAKQGGAGEVAGAGVIGEGEQGVELMLVDRESVGHIGDSQEQAIINFRQILELLPKIVSLRCIIKAHCQDDN